MRLEADGLSLHVDAPKGALTDEARHKLADNKQPILRLLHRERKKLEDADRRGLAIKWAREPGWISLHDPTTGDWHDVKASECPPSVVESARAYRRVNRDR